ncbi:GTP-binding protein Rit2 isoform X1 [Equus asinus]|uniref:small monomeric GTPase n=1 Tax=Equus caballus TaxID=9796 RepID=A0A5F5PPE0_HORSE
MEVENEASCSPSSASGGSREYKVVMLGAGGVGKSEWHFLVGIQHSPGHSGTHCGFAMTMQFISHQFPDYHDPTIEDAYKTQVRIDNEPAYLDILDTAGQAEFTAMREQYMRGGEGFIICYSVTDRQSFQEAAKFKELIFQVRHTYEIPLVLVGNKIDLEQFRQVSTEEGLSLAREYNCAFFETSAALRFCIDDAFHGLVREIRKKESMPSLMEKKLKRKDSLWKKLKGSLKKKRENMT